MGQDLSQVPECHVTGLRMSSHRGVERKLEKLSSCPLFQTSSWRAFTVLRNWWCPQPKLKRYFLSGEIFALALHQPGTDVHPPGSGSWQQASVRAWAIPRGADIEC